MCEFFVSFDKTIHHDHTRHFIHNEMTANSNIIFYFLLIYGILKLPILLGRYLKVGSAGIQGDAAI